MQRYRDLIGNTPIIDLSHLVENEYGIESVQVLCKVEFLNPGFSVKDRVVQHILDSAEKNGILTPGSGQVIVAASSGNTGAATAMLAAMRGYKAIITTSPKCSMEKRNSILAYGAELIVSPSGLQESHAEHYMNLGRRIAEENGYFDVNQYDNMENPEAHYHSLAPEIWEATNGEITHFVAAGSTGGTISGVSRFLKEKNPEIEVILADPVGSVFTDFFVRGKNKKSKTIFFVEGVGKGNIPGTIDFTLIDGVCNVEDSDAFAMCRLLAENEGILVGGSSGLNTFAAISLANRATKPCTIVTLLPDSGLKYLSKIYNQNWLLKNNVFKDFPDFSNCGPVTKSEISHECKLMYERA